MHKKLIYLDNAATNETMPEALKAMQPYFSELYGNPSSIYDLGIKSKEAIESSRNLLAKIINCEEEEIYFTAGGTESDNFATKQTAQCYGYRGNHIITTSIEHRAVLNSCKFLEENGYRVTYLKVNEYGQVNLKDIERHITNDTILISIMHANNEIGTLQPIKEIGMLARRHGVIFHTDAVQSVCHEPIDVKKLKIDILSASAHKFGGPKGVGFMYINKSLKYTPLLHGGSQERHLRAGTGNVPGVVGMAKAAEVSNENMEKNNKYVRDLRDYLVKRVTSEIEGVILNGDPKNRLAGNANFLFEGVEGEAMLVMLDMKGICVSTGSACAQGGGNLSHVLKAIGLSDEKTRSSIRMTLSEKNTKKEIDYTVEAVKEIVSELRGK